MGLKIIATYNGEKIFTGITQISIDAKLIEGQTEILPTSEDANYFNGTEWEHKDIPTPEQQLAMQQQVSISQLQQLVMNQQQQIMQLKGSN